MQRIMLKSKIHGAKVTDADIDYEGSITIDQDLIEEANLCVFEKVDVYNVTNGNRFSTYVISGERGSGEMCLNGAAARLVSKGDKIIVASYVAMDESEVAAHKPKLVFMDENNKPKNIPKLAQVTA